MAIRERVFFPQKLLGHCPGYPENGPGPRAARTPGVLGQRSQGQGGIVEEFCAGPGIGLDSP